MWQATIAETFPNMVKEMVTQIQEAQSPRPRRSWQIVIKLTEIKDEEKILNATREKQLRACKGIPIRLSVDMSGETLQTKREWHDVFKVTKGKNVKPRILYPARLPFKLDREIKNATIKQWLRESSTIRPTLQIMLKDLFLS